MVAVQPFKSWKLYVILQTGLDTQLVMQQCRNFVMVKLRLVRHL